MAAQDIGRMLMGLSAGIQGRGTEFMQGQQRQQMIDQEQSRLDQERKRKAELERMKTVFKDSQGALKLGEQGRFDLIGQMGRERIDILGAMGVDSGDTQKLTAIADAAATGDVQAQKTLMETLANNVSIGRGLGVLESPSGKTRSDIEREIAVKEEANKLRAEELGFRKDQAGELKISPTVQKILDSSQERAFSAGESARELELLAKDISGVDLGQGVPSTFSEKLKAATGSTDAVSDLRRRFRGFRSSRAINNLPPGVASDKDIELALSGFPAENANDNTINSFLLGQAKLARIEEAFNITKSELISETGGTSNLLKVWNSKIKDPDFQESIFSGISGISRADQSGTSAEFGRSEADILNQYGIQ